MPGCTCMSTRAPCSWCTSLTQEEVDILDTYGEHVLVWLQENAFLADGTFTYETEPHLEQLRWVEFQSAIKIAQESIEARRNNHAARLDQIIASHDTMVRTLHKVYDSAKQYLDNRPKASVIRPAFNKKQTRLPLTFTLINLASYSHRRPK
jgi:hypothetical protein